MWAAFVSQGNHVKGESLLAASPWLVTKAAAAPQPEQLDFFQQLRRHQNISICVRKDPVTPGCPLLFYHFPLGWLRACSAIGYVPQASLLGRYDRKRWNERGRRQTDRQLHR